MRFVPSMRVVPTHFVSTDDMWHIDDLKRGVAGPEYCKLSDDRLLEIQITSITSGLSPRIVQEIVDACEYGHIPFGYDVRRTSLTNPVTRERYDFDGLFTTIPIRKYQIIGAYESSTKNIRLEKGYTMDIQALKKVTYKTKTYYIPYPKKKLVRSVDARKRKKSTFVRYINAANTALATPTCDDSKVNVVFAEAMSKRDGPVVIAYALHDIGVGQELFVDYGPCFWS